MHPVFRTGARSVCFNELSPLPHPALYQTWPLCHFCHFVTLPHTNSTSYRTHAAWLDYFFTSNWRPWIDRFLLQKLFDVHALNPVQPNIPDERKEEFSERGRIFDLDERDGKVLQPAKQTVALLQAGLASHSFHTLLLAPFYPSFLSHDLTETRATTNRTETENQCFRPSRDGGEERSGRSGRPHATAFESEPERD